VIKRISLVIVVALVAAALLVPSTALGAPLPDNCTKDQGTVTCTTGPGNQDRNPPNQGGVGSVDETQGNTTNTSPEEPQDLDSTCRPANSRHCQ
jgi:hypothetical protein